MRLLGSTYFSLRTQGSTTVPREESSQLSESTHPDLSVLLSLLSLLPVSCLIYNEASQVPNLL